MIVHEHGNRVEQETGWWVGRFYRCHYCGCRFEMEPVDTHIPSRAILKPNIETIMVRCPECRYVLELAANPDDPLGLIGLNA